MLGLRLELWLGLWLGLRLAFRIRFGPDRQPRLALACRLRLSLVGLGSRSGTVPGL